MVRVAEYFPPLAQPRDGNLSTSRRNNPQTLRRRQREDASILRRGAIPRPSHARPVYVVINNIAIRTGTGRPPTPAVADDANESEPLETQPSAVGIVQSEMITDAQLAIQMLKLGIEVVAKRSTTIESRPAQPGYRQLFERLSRYISGLWS
ncbi:hypothetical protein CCMA1212_008510 [Trichoderma ghanense]|uniref:Uncharacterized protein n=1 Tax=Trichoderma ghanense TaxID=65468 RepID=A0ABY2GV29_9HYPO